MKLSHFQFNLPTELLAEFPAENRDESRLMVINRAKKTIEHKLFDAKFNRCKKLLDVREKYFHFRMFQIP